mmetsp:Transcript_23245/g.50367  ORF Transcript_23245/g.50367 Transcript_23245/m.50367 type:complete len:380 (+) Transcript_23245:132-1271(+)
MTLLRRKSHSHHVTMCAIIAAATTSVLSAGASSPTIGCVIRDAWSSFPSATTMSSSSYRQCESSARLSRKRLANITAFQQHDGSLFAKRAAPTKTKQHDIRITHQRNSNTALLNNVNNDDETPKTSSPSFLSTSKASVSFKNNRNSNNNNNNNNAVEFQLEDAMECTEMEVDEDALQYYYYNQGGDSQQQYNNANYYNQNNNQNQEMKLFVGPYCSANGKSIFLGTFMDETCSYPAPSGTYESFSYGAALPYSQESLVANSCLSCKEPQDADDQNDGDQDDEDEVLEVCERLYEDAGKCESGLADGVTYYPNTYACTLIQSLKAPGKMNSTRSSIAASKVFAGLFAATTAVFAGVAYYLYHKSRRQNVHLSSNDGGTLA